jgi:hypothetical protein
VVNRTAVSGVKWFRKMTSYVEVYPREAHW